MTDSRINPEYRKLSCRHCGKPWQPGMTVVHKPGPQGLYPDTADCGRCLRGKARSEVTEAPVFHAVNPAFCRTCGGWVRKGEAIRRKETGIVHASCR